MSWFSRPLALLLILGASGCASPYAFRRADCVCYKHIAYNKCVCNDDAVDKNCSKRLIKGGSKRDDGLSFKDNPYFVRACAIFYKFTKPTVVVGRSHQGCGDHEVCHIEGFPADVCAEKFPCVEDVER